MYNQLSKNKTLAFLNIRGLSLRSSRVRKLEHLKTIMGVAKIPFLFLSECHLSDKQWAETSVLPPTWKVVHIADWHDPDSKEFGVIVHGEATNDISINTIDVPDLPKGAVAVHCVIYEIEIDLILLHSSPNANSAKRNFYTFLTPHRRIKK